jgi:hypothetical protein
MTSKLKKKMSSSGEVQWRPAYWLYGVRHIGGMTLALVLALVKKVVY